jgi:hypothetical protein
MSGGVGLGTSYLVVEKLNLFPEKQSESSKQLQLDTNVYTYTGNIKLQENSNLSRMSGFNIKIEQNSFFYVIKFIAVIVRGTKEDFKLTLSEETWWRMRQDLTLGLKGVCSRILCT